MPTWSGKAEERPPRDATWTSHGSVQGRRRSVDTRDSDLGGGGLCIFPVLVPQLPRWAEASALMRNWWRHALVRDAGLSRHRQIHLPTLFSNLFFLIKKKIPPCRLNTHGECHFPQLCFYQVWIWKLLPYSEQILYKGNLQSLWKTELKGSIFWGWNSFEIHA